MKSLPLLSPAKNNASGRSGAIAAKSQFGDAQILRLIGGNMVERFGRALSIEISGLGEWAPEALIVDRRRFGDVLQARPLWKATYAEPLRP